MIVKYKVSDFAKDLNLSAKKVLDCLLYTSFDVALIQDVVADEDWYDEHSEIGITEAQKIRKRCV